MAEFHSAATRNFQAIKVFDLKHQRIQCEVHVSERLFLTRFIEFIGDMSWQMPISNCGVGPRANISGALLHIVVLDENQ
jgi:hypothetical protein